MPIDAPPRKTRERDLTGWIVTPIATLVIVPPLTLILAVITLTGTQAPAICHDVATANGCEERTLGLIGEHVVLFLALWLLLWALPWWRSLRAWRTALAVLAAAALLAAPLRMSADDNPSDGSPSGDQQTTITTNPN
ncbi:hypothetical protein ACTI_57240 [Actinoplanes sp. OR16]|uniref:hypothetical protein n=1 Tax=Actinoplanes sp. OR16 TaxID=946334 RepID=UPI000F6C5B86|nr:hypothetical protein [Actinoplanes sp. OR16]BBH69039.1 hypothetical protein ACTI_57240 [Actinoplanes sp. OR16]